MKLQVMNQEEFDNKLGESFKNEHLPPDKRLWENISARLDEGKKKPFSLWLIPVFVAVLAVGAWAISSIGGKTNMANNDAIQVKTAISENKTNSEIQSNSVTNSETSEIVESSSNQGGAVSSVHRTNYTETNNNSENRSNIDKRSNNGIQNNSDKLSNTDKNNSSASNGVETKTNTASTSTPNAFEGTPVTPNNPRTSHPIVDILNFDFNDIHSKKQPYTQPKLSLFDPPTDEEEIKSDLKLKKGKLIRSRYTKQPVDFDSKWWWSVGFGPQVSFNQLVINDDSVSKIHKDLWANRELLTHNGSGFNSQFLLGHRLGEHFSIETGLQYGRHAEDIKFNITSFSVETRDQSSNITAYEDSVIFWIVLSSHPYDTTYYYATRGFSLVSKNRYQIFTIPLKFNYEQNITPNTKIVAGIGAGISGIRSKSVKHLTLFNDTYFEEKKSTQFTASFNAQFGMYTNINEIGQLGFYTNFQMYAKPWEMGNKQYAIRMSDLQFGISFRRPLNWK